MCCVWQNAIEINVDPATVTSEDLDVQRATLLMVNAAAHHQPGTIAPYLEDYVVSCHGRLLLTRIQTMSCSHTPADWVVLGLQVKLLDKSMTLTLERKVNLGPFTHTVRRPSIACPPSPVSCQGPLASIQSHPCFSSPS